MLLAIQPAHTQANDAIDLPTINFQLPFSGQEQTYRVTIAAAPEDRPDWLVSTFVAGVAKTVDSSNQGRFSVTWNGLDDNFMPVPKGRYVFKGIYMPASRWKIDGRHHSLIPQYVASPGDSWSPPPDQDHRFPPIHGHVFEPIRDIAIADDGRAVFLGGYIENWKNPFLIDLNRSIGPDQVLRTWDSSGRAGGQHVAFDGSHVWMIRFNEVYCFTNSAFGTTRTRRGRRVAVLGSDRSGVTDMAVSRQSDPPMLYICEPSRKRIVVLDGKTGQRSHEIDGLEATAITIMKDEAGNDAIFVLNRNDDAWQVSRLSPESQAQPVMTLPGGPTPRDLAIDDEGNMFTIRGRQVIGYDSQGRTTCVIGKNKQLQGSYDEQVLIHPNRLAVWTDDSGQSRLLVIEHGGAMRIGEWNCRSGKLLRQWHLTQNAAGGYCIDPSNPQHVYTTSLNTPELIRYHVDYETGKWRVDAIWEGMCHRDGEKQFPGGRMFPQLIQYRDHRYLCFAGGSFRAWGGWIVYREDNGRWIPSSAYLGNRWWRDANGDGSRQPSEFVTPKQRGVGTYWAGKFLDDLSILEIPKRGHAVRRLSPSGFDRHGNPVYEESTWEVIAHDPFSAAIAEHRSNELTPLDGGNEVGNQFWDWSDATRGPDGSIYVAGVYKPDGITGYRFDEAGQVCAQWKLSRWTPDRNGQFQQDWRVGRKAFGVAAQGEVYATMHIGPPIHGLLGMHDPNGMYHVFTTSGLYVDSLMYDRFRFGSLERGGVYCHSGGAYYGRHHLNRNDGHVYITMGRSSNLIYRVPAWTPGTVQPLIIKTASVNVQTVSMPPKHVVQLRQRHKLPVPSPPTHSSNASNKPSDLRTGIIAKLMQPLNAAEMIRLTDLSPLAAKASYYPVGINRYSGDQRQKFPVLNGQRCESFLFAHAPSTLVYAIPPACQAFTAIGCTLNRSDFAFVVRIDGHEVFRSKRLADIGQAVPIQIPLPDNARKLELIVDPLENPRADHAAWAFPRFIRPPTANPPRP